MHFIRLYVKFERNANEEVRIRGEDQVREEKGAFCFRTSERDRRGWEDDRFWNVCVCLRKKEIDRHLQVFMKKWSKSSTKPGFQASWRYQPSSDRTLSNNFRVFFSNFDKPFWTFDIFYKFFLLYIFFLDFTYLEDEDKKGICVWQSCVFLKRVCFEFKRTKSEIKRSEVKLNTIQKATDWMRLA